MSGMAPAGTSIYSDGFLVKFQDNSAGINEVSSEQDNVIISPNPNEGEFSINGETGLAEGVFELRVADITGRIVYTSKAAIKDRKLSSNIKLPEGLPAGVYVLTLNNADISKSILFVKK